MTSDFDLRRHRAEANRLRGEIAKASSTAAAKRKKAADASAAAAKSRSVGTIKSKAAEAERATKEAIAAEQKRAGLEKKLADVEVRATKAQEKLDKERQATHDRALQDLRRSAERASSRFGLHDGLVPRMSIGAAVEQDPVHDVFLCHAGEDKEEMARPLRDALEARGVTVWFDEVNIKVGQSIRDRVERGISTCRFGVVVISPSFFVKPWTMAELDALFDKKMDSGQDVVLPIWHRVSRDEVVRHLPLLAGTLALNSATMTIDEMADEIRDAVHAATPPADLTA
jgi:TIR domain